MKPRAAAAPTAKGRALHGKGEAPVNVAPETVWGMLLDPKTLARIIPGCHKLESVGANHYRAEVTVGVSLVKARYQADIALSHLDPPRALRLSGTGSSALGTASGTGMVELEVIPGGTRLYYDYHAEVGGKVAAVGSRMLEGAARLVLAQLFEQLGWQAAGTGRPAPARSWLYRLLRWLGMRA